MSRLIQTFFSSANFLIVFVVLTGCGGPSEKSFIPKADLAQEALEHVLEAWKSGAAHGTLNEFSVPIDVFDARWQKGRKLESYEILREEKSEGPKTFVVKMKLADDAEESEIKYLIVGKSPLLVFTESDYKKATGGGG